MVQNDPAPAEFAEKAVAYAEAKTAYFTALREETPELINTATRRKLRPLQLDNFIATFAVAGEKQEKATDENTLTLRKRDECRLGAKFLSKATVTESLWA
jgi:hypothetical protein